MDATPNSIYLMHKYWGKKPSSELREIVENNTEIGDLILDPFSGYGGMGVEGFLLGRSVVLNDLNPIANNISRNVMRVDIDIKKLKYMYGLIKEKYKDKEKEWYHYRNEKIVTILRDKNNNILKLKLKSNISNKFYEYKITEKDVNDFIKKEDSYSIKEWYPKNRLIPNSRICVKNDMFIEDLFSKRSLICNAFLFELINSFDDSPEKELLKFAFTSNVANCSKLVPPIKSRGEMSQGAWMTGFYIGETYLENNVFHYFENRVKKIIKGKQDFIDICNKNNVGSYNITNYDAKKLDIVSDSVDLVFTDFPYGDSVPYFEQSQLWNSWLNYSVNYKDEIVISDSNFRNKKSTEFAHDIEMAISEIYRVLKKQKYFIFTFHSIQGHEWNSIIKAIQKFNFKFIESKILIQKTLPPRQLNRKHTIKGDVIVKYMKVGKKNDCKLIKDTNTLIQELFDCSKTYSTNKIIIKIVNEVLKNNIVLEDMDFPKLIKNYFNVCNEEWRLKNDV